LDTLLDEALQVWKDRVVQRPRSRTGGHGRHIGYTVVAHTVLDEDRIVVRRRPRRFTAAPLVDRHVNQQRPRPHALDHFRGDDTRGTRAWHEYRADDDIGRGQARLERIGSRVGEPDPA